MSSGKNRPPQRSSQGAGEIDRTKFGNLGERVVLEAGVLVFHPENIEIGDDVYVGHYTILKGYHLGKMIIGSGTWIGQQGFFHSAGNLTIGQNVGVGPAVKILTSHHAEEGILRPILHSHIEFKPVFIKDDADIGAGAVILPGVTIGRGAQVGAGAVVTRDVDDYAIVAGVPARFLRFRTKSENLASSE